MSENRGAFYIPADDKTDDTDFKVPGDQVGETPDGTDNPSQASYSIDNRQRKHGKQYYVHVKNGWDVSVDVGIEGSSFDDEEMVKAVVEQPTETVGSGNKTVFEDDTGHSYLQVIVENLTAPPSSGVLEIVVQDRYR